MSFNNGDFSDYVAGLSGLSIFIAPSVFSNVYFRMSEVTTWDC